MKDFLGDMITRMKNAQRAKLKMIDMSPYLPTKYKKILNILTKEGFLRGYVWHSNSNTKNKPGQKIIVLLKYNIRGEPIIHNIVQVSTPGRRIYMSTESLWQAQSTRGLYILSTSKGILTALEAKRLNVGGELLLCVW